LGRSVYRLVPGEDTPVRSATEPPRESPRRLDNGILAVELAADGTLSVTAADTGYRATGLLELLDDGDRGDEYGFGAVDGDEPISSRTATWRPGTDRKSVVEGKGVQDGVRRGSGAIQRRSHRATRAAGRA